MKWISSALCIVLAVFIGGCGNYQLADGSLGRLRYSDLFSPYYEFIFVNNTNVLIDVEVGGDLVKRNLAPGETFSWPIYYFNDGDRVAVVVKGHRDGAYVGMDVWKITLRSSYSYRRSSSREEIFVVDRLTPLTNVGGQGRPVPNPGWAPGAG